MEQAKIKIEKGEVEIYTIQYKEYEKATFYLFCNRGTLIFNMGRRTFSIQYSRPDLNIKEFIILYSLEFILDEFMKFVDVGWLDNSNERILISEFIKVIKNNSSL